MYAKIQNNTPIEWPVHDFQIRSSLPEVSLPAQITAEIVALFNFEPYMEADKPEFHSLVQSVQETAPIKQDGVWVQQWTVGEKYSAEEKEQILADAEDHKLKAQKANVRAERNTKLAETDWRFRSDMTPSQQWIDYCQALRDVTAQPGFPWSVTWPTQPE